MNEVDFSRYLEKCEDRLLAHILLSSKLIDQKTLYHVYQEMRQREECCKLGQLLIQKRLLQIRDYTKAIALVRQQAQILYQKARSIENGENFTLETSEKLPVQHTPQTKVKLKKIRIHRKSASKEASSSKDASYSESSQEKKSSKQTTFFGGYEIIEEIARGGMGIVYKARQLQLNRVVALKVLLAGGAASEKEISRFEREAEAAGSLQHPNIVTIYEKGKHDGHHYFTMDFIEGKTLQELIKKRKRRKMLIRALEKVCRALDHAHSKNIIHRDIKPSNIIMAPNCEPKITDFGLAKQLDAELVLTESGTTLGTPFYMAPEQTLGQKDIDGRADIYSVGVILYEILTNRLPFNAGTLVELYHKVVQDDPIPPSKINRKVDTAIELVCLKAMEKDPQRRYQKASELADDLRRYLHGESVLAKKAGLTYRLKRYFVHYSNSLMISAGVTLLFLFVLLFFILQTTKHVDQEGRLLQARNLLADGNHLISQGSFSAGIKKIEQVIKRFPRFKDAYMAKGKAYLEKQRYHDALNEYARISDLAPEYAPAYLGKGKAYMGLREWDKAIQSFSEAIRHDAEFIEAYVGRGNAWGPRKTGTEDLENAIKDHEKADFLKKKILLKGRSLLRRKEYDAARKVFKRILRADDTYFLAYYYIGRVHMLKKQWDQAIEQFRLTLKYHNDYVDAYSQLAKAYQRKGLFSQAQEILKKISRIKKKKL